MQDCFGSTHVFPISLGYSCHVKVFIDMIFEKERMPNPRLPFDWIGTSMWSICKLLETKFDQFTDTSVIDQRKRFTDAPKLYITNTLYNTPFLHDYGKDGTDISTISEEKWEKVEDDYKRRIERLYQLLDATKHLNKTIVFLRLEQDKRKRIEYPEFQQEHEEPYFLEKFASIMKERGVRFLVLYFTTSYETKHDTENNICYVKYGVKDPEMVLGAEQINLIYQANIGFIKKAIQYSLHVNRLSS